MVEKEQTVPTNSIGIGLNILATRGQTNSISCISALIRKMTGKTFELRIPFAASFVQKNLAQSSSMAWTHCRYSFGFTWPHWECTRFLQGVGSFRRSYSIRVVARHSRAGVAECDGRDGRFDSPSTNSSHLFHSRKESVDIRVLGANEFSGSRAAIGL